MLKTHSGKVLQTGGERKCRTGYLYWTVAGGHGKLATWHTRTKFQRARSLMVCHCFVWTLHSTLPNPSGKLASERCKTLKEKISKQKTTTLFSVFAPFISKISGSCYKHYELIISISPWECICIRNLQCVSQWQIYIALKKILEAVWSLFGYDHTESILALWDQNFSLLSSKA